MCSSGVSAASSGRQATGRLARLPRNGQGVLHAPVRDLEPRVDQHDVGHARTFSCDAGPRRSRRRLIRRMLHHTADRRTIPSRQPGPIGRRIGRPGPALRSDGPRFPAPVRRRIPIHQATIVRDPRNGSPADVDHDRRPPAVRRGPTGDVPPFEPHPWLADPHLQTIVARYWPWPRHRLPSTYAEVDAGDGDRLSVLESIPEGWSPGDPAVAPGPRPGGLRPVALRRPGRARSWSTWGSGSSG